MQISISQAKIRLNNLVSSIETSIITKNGAPKAVIMPYKAYRAMLRLQRAEDDKIAIQKAEEHFSGKRKAVSQEELDQLIRKQNDSKSLL